MAPAFLRQQHRPSKDEAEGCCSAARQPHISSHGALSVDAGTNGVGWGCRYASVHQEILHLNQQLVVQHKAGVSKSITGPIRCLLRGDCIAVLASVKMKLNQTLIFIPLA